MAIKTIAVHCVGISPILMNPMTEETLDELYGGAAARKPKTGQVPQKQVAEAKIIKDGDDRVGLPVEYLFSCLVGAGRFVKYDAKKNISNASSTLIPSFMSIEELFLPFDNQDAKWFVDKRRGRLSNGTAVCILRPRFEDWSFDVTIEIDDQEISEEKVKELFRRAGTAVGLGDFRPACRGPFGRFKIERWEVLKQDMAEAA